MPTIDPQVAHHRGRKAIAVRHGRRDMAEDADQKLRAARLAAYIRKLVDEWPPLTNEQRSDLAALLRPGGDR